MRSVFFGIGSRVDLVFTIRRDFDILLILLFLFDKLEKRKCVRLVSDDGRLAGGAGFAYRLMSRPILS